MILDGISIFLSILFGFLFGMGTALLITFINQRRINKRNSAKKKKQIKPFKVKNKPQKTKTTNMNKKRFTTNKDGNELLKSKLKKSDLSYVEFNCAADGVDESTHIRERQAHEDKAYNILKNKKKH